MSKPVCFLFKHQRGFGKEFSCDMQPLAEFTQDLYHSMDRNYQIVAIFVDLSEAFVRVLHLRLITNFKYRLQQAYMD